MTIGSRQGGHETRTPHVLDTLGECGVRSTCTTLNRLTRGWCWPVMLTPADSEKLLLAVAGMVARDRLGRGVRLNHPEAVALLSTWVIERAREGASVSDLMVQGRSVLTRAEVMDGVAEMLSDVQVEATFPDGRKLVTLHDPIS